MEERRFLYVIGAPEGPYKIGHSANPTRRYEELQAANPQLIGLYYLVEVRPQDALAAEKVAHRKVWEWRLHGEWFHITRQYAIDTIIAAAAEVGSGKLYPHRNPKRVQRGADYLRTMWRNGRLTETQYEVGRRYRAAYEVQTGGDGYGQPIPGRKRGFSPAPEDGMDRAFAFKRAERAVLEAHGLAALAMLRRVAGEGASVASLMKGGVGHGKIVSVITAALETAATFLLDDGA